MLTYADALVWNDDRVYGPVRLGMLLSDWLAEAAFFTTASSNKLGSKSAEGEQQRHAEAALEIAVFYLVTPGGGGSRSEEDSGATGGGGETTLPHCEVGEWGRGGN
jgi:hypothetical protein